VVWCGVVWCGVVWCGVVWCGVVWCGVVWCGVSLSQPPNIDGWTPLRGFYVLTNIEKANCPTHCPLAQALPQPHTLTASLTGGAGARGWHTNGSL
jgi:hypothetical protein